MVRDAKHRHRRRSSERAARDDEMHRESTRRGIRVSEEIYSSSLLPDSAILLMGLTGVGKSTFISHLTQQNIKIGHSLESCTKDVDGYPFVRQNGQRIFLIDTPGFDDTEEDNGILLQRIAMILHTFHQTQCFDVVGLLYFHRITDARMAGSSLKSLRLFEKICGSQNFGAVSIVTTMWGLLKGEDAHQHAMKRAESLKSTPEFFGNLIQGGAIMVQHDNTFKRAVEIVEHLAKRNQSVLLDMQVEMVDEGRSLRETSAGQFLHGELSEVRAKYKRELQHLQEALEEARHEEDEDLVSTISEQQRECEEYIKKSDLAQEDLLMTSEQLAQQQSEWLDRRYKEVDNEEMGIEEKSAREIELEEQLLRTEMDHIREMNKLRRENKGKVAENEELKRGYEAEIRRMTDQLGNEKAQRMTRKEAGVALYKTMQTGFINLLRKAVGADLAGGPPPRRAVTFPQETKVQNLLQGSRQSPNRGQQDSWRRKHRKKKLPKPVLGQVNDHGYEEHDDQESDSSSEEEYPMRTLSAPIRTNTNPQYVEDEIVIRHTMQHRTPSSNHTGVTFSPYAGDPSRDPRNGPQVQLHRVYSPGNERR